MSFSHGRLGMRSALRTFDQLDDESAYSKHAYADIHAGQLVPGGWSFVASGTYSVPWNYVFDNKPLDASGVTTSTEVLTRVQSLALCQATAGTYWFDYETAVRSVSAFDSEGFDLDLGWDDGAELYVHLTGDADPALTKVMVDTIFGIWTGSKERPELCVQPILGPNLMVDGGLEVWNSSTDLANYSEILTGAGMTLTQIAALTEGLYAARCAGTGAASGSVVARQNALPLIAGSSYRASVAYSTDASNPSTAGAYMQFGTTDTITSNGRDIESGITNGVRMDDTHGLIRRAVFDFIAHETDPRVRLTAANSAATAFGVTFDDFRVQRIYGWRWYSPRLPAEGLPESVMGASDVYPGSEEGGGGQVSIVNESATTYCERMFSPPWSFSSKLVQLRFGGVFLDNQEITFENMRLGFSGIIRGWSVSDKRAVVDVEELRDILGTQIPLRSYNRLDQPAVEERALSRARPLLFGVKSNILPARVDKTAATGYGIYELCDPTDATVNGIGGAGGAAGGNVWAYLDEEAADKKDTTKRVQLLDSANDWSQSVTTARLTITHDVRPIVIDRSNNKLDFNIGGGALAASIPAGIYYIGDGSNPSSGFRRGLLEQIRQAMNAAAAVADFNVTYSETTHLVTIAKGAGTLNLLTNSGASEIGSVFPLLGFDTGADRTGALSYAADSVIFTDCDSQHVIRCDVAGYLDDASGTYTGSAGNAIVKGPDVDKFLLLRSLKQDPVVITSSFTTARATARSTAAYLGALAAIQGGASGTLSVQDVFDRHEAGDFSDVVMDGAGLFYYVPRSSTVPSDVVDLYDRDFLEWEVGIRVDDCFGTVRINYAQDPTTGLVQGREVTNAETVLLHGRPHLRTFDSFLTTDGDAASAVQQLGFLARAPIREFRFTTKGKLLTKKVGDLIRLTRARSPQGVDETGGLNQLVVRIRWISKNYLTHKVKVIAHTNIVS